MRKRGIKRNWKERGIIAKLQQGTATRKYRAKIRKEGIKHGLSKRI